MSHRFGWCMDGHHKTCPHEVYRIVSDGTAEISTCGCPCHTDDFEPSATLTHNITDRRTNE